MEIKEYIKTGFINAFQMKFVGKMAEENVVCLKETLEDETIKNYILRRTSCFNKRMLDSLKLVNLSEEILNKKMSILSSSEKLKIELAIVLILNSAVVYLYQFDAYFMEKDLSYFKKLFKKLVSKYHKTIVFINSKPSFLMDFADYYFIEKKKDVFIEVEKPTFYENIFADSTDKPKIVEFVQYVKEKDNKIKEYVDLKELLKAIFREVK